MRRGCWQIENLELFREISHVSLLILKPDFSKTKYMVITDWQTLHIVFLCFLLYFWKIFYHKINWI
ncbi:hypothetical protein A1355_07210 [Methylomonas koyamae]|uniref:Uncharacterized protein n=1 Tax=Methylomonas koyamae TaxID=702114 RepID=A0A177NIP6_9GAMM|nr:hypothetical protein A1355_07210 [Methylomonas koyamae]